MQCGASRTSPARSDNVIQCVHFYSLSVPAKYRGAYTAPFVYCKKVRLLNLRTQFWTGIATCYGPDGSDEIFSIRPERSWGPDSLLYSRYLVSF